MPANMNRREDAIMRAMMTWLSLMILCGAIVALTAADQSMPNLCNFPVWLQEQGLTNGCVTNQQWHAGVHAYEAARQNGTLSHYTSVPQPAQASAPAQAPAPASNTGSSSGGDPNMCHVWGFAFCATQDHWIAGWYAHPDNGAYAEDIPPGNIAYIIAFTGSVLPSRHAAAAPEPPKVDCKVTAHKASSARVFITSSNCEIGDVTHGRGIESWKRFTLGVPIDQNIAWQVHISIERTKSPVDFKYRLSHADAGQCDYDGQGTAGNIRFHARTRKVLQGRRKHVIAYMACEKA